jgi:membrane-associated protease RseP (regulator of RpoE activity)
MALMQGFLGGFSVISAIIIFVVAHEAGHFFAAKATGMKVTEFFLGFGPRIWSFKRGETEYGIKPIPFGAYVKIVGMSSLEEVDPADIGRTYREKVFWKKSVVVLAGVAANFLLAYLIFFGLIVSAGEQLPTTEVAAVVTPEEGPPVAAAAAGVEAGDVILAIDSVPMTDWETLATTVGSLAGRTVVLEIDRAGAIIELDATIGSREDPASGGEVGFLGVGPVYERMPVSVFAATGRAAQEVWFQISGTFQAFSQIFRFDTLGRLAGGMVGGEVDNEVRPVSVVGLAQIGAQADRIGIANMFYLMAAVNVVLGLINVLPLFPLDGGHFAVALFEKLTRRKVDVRALVPVAVLVIGALSIFGVMTIILDIVNPIQIPS